MQPVGVAQGFLKIINLHLSDVFGRVVYTLLLWKVFLTTRKRVQLTLDILIFEGTYERVRDIESSNYQEVGFRIKSMTYFLEKSSIFIWKINLQLLERRGNWLLFKIFNLTHLRRFSIFTTKEFISYTCWLLERDVFWITSSAPSNLSHDGRLGPSTSKSISSGCHSSSSTLSSSAKTE